MLLGLALAALIALLAIGVLYRARRTAPPPQPTVEPPPHRLAELCAALSGDPLRDRPTLNRILALGATTVPLLLDQLGQLTKSTDQGDIARPQRQARIEELVADFGLSSAQTIAQQLTRVRPGSPQDASLSRIIHRLGHGGGVSILRTSLEQADLIPFLPRLRLQGSPIAAPGDALLAALQDRPVHQRRTDLDALAGLLCDHPDVIERLWPKWDSEGRQAIMGWLADWLPLARPELVALGLSDPCPSVRCAAARLATLMIHPALVDPLVELTRDNDPACRHAAIYALGSQHLPGALEPVRQAVSDPMPEISLCAAMCMWRRNDPGLREQLGRMEAMGHDPRRRLLEEAVSLRSAGTQSIEPLLTAVSGANSALRAFGLGLLGGFIHDDPRARERLIRAADESSVSDRVAAVGVLARTRDSTAPDLLAASIPDVRRHAERSEYAFLLQEAAQCLGDLAVPPLARGVIAQRPKDVPALLAVLRCLPYAPAVPTLLRGLEKVRGEPLEGVVAATLYVGGSETRSAVHACLREPRRGLLVPALTYLAAYGTPDDLPTLINLYEHHPPLRGILLNLIETQGTPAVAILEERVRRGGDDAIVAGLETRLAVLKACVPRPEADP